MFPVPVTLSTEGRQRIAAEGSACPLGKERLSMLKLQTVCGGRL